MFRDTFGCRTPQAEVALRAGRQLVATWVVGDDLYTIAMGIFEDPFALGIPDDDRVVRTATRKFRAFSAVGHRIHQVFMAS